MAGFVAAVAGELASALQPNVQTLLVEDDHFRHLVFYPQLNSTSNVTFTLDGRPASDNTTYSEDGENLVIAVLYPPNNTPVTDTFQPDGSQLIRIFRTSNVVARRYFLKSTYPGQPTPN